MTEMKYRGDAVVSRSSETVNWPQKTVPSLRT
jgi:hypothetical protein